MRWWGPIRQRVVAKLAAADYVAESFTLHDLRRAAMTGMTRLGVTRFVAQRVRGHIEGGVGGVDDRNSYLAERADALNRWTAHVYRIANEDRSELLSFSRRLGLGAAGRSGGRTLT